jgi:hypothetical protein
MSLVATRWLVSFGVCSVLAQAGAAHAFSDPASFQLSPVAAGGGGRFFTGSPADGYTCKVCHEGADAPSATVLGLPLSGYRPGVSYELTVQWPEQQKKIALALELTDSRGRSAGSVRLPPQNEIEAPEFCDPESDQILAAQLSELPDTRQIISVPDCGSKRVRFLWIAPETDVGPVWFAGSMVTSDGEGDPFHDGVTDFGRIIHSPAIASNTTAQCSVRAGRVAGTASGWLSVIALVLSMIRARSFRRRGRHT